MATKGHSLGIGIIGAGRIADLHVRAYINNPRARLIAVADAAPGRAKQRAEEWGAEHAYRDLGELLGRDDIDAVEILLPHHLHSQVAIDALRAGKAVSLQKPPGMDLAEADALFRIAKAQPHVFRVFDNFLYWEPFQFARKLLEDDAIGEPLMLKLSAVYGRGIGGWDIPSDAIAWRSNPANSGGPPAIVDHGAHMAATMVYLMGDVEAVHTFNLTANESSGVLNNAPLAISCKFSAANRLGVWTMTRTAELPVETDYYPGDEFLEITGSRGMLWVNQCSGRLLNRPPVTLLKDGKFIHFDSFELDWGESFRAGGEDFVKGVLDGYSPLMDAAFARKVFLFQLAAVLSAAEHREVRVSECDTG